EGIVYKRRVPTTQPAVERFFDYEGDICADGQIAREISYFRGYYKKLVPAILIIYDRNAYFEPDGDLRLTIDFNPRYRTTDLNLTTSMEGIPLLPEGHAILEIKVQEAMPLWLTEILATNKIYKGSFSKVGEAYKQQARKIYQQEGRKVYV
ncbi:MAG: VTC domain-containing protein, partial [Clostridia bacterium]|nr:VTC domain-containing protein [Clostridia bacterium]